MPARIHVDEALPETKREGIANAVRGRLGAGADVDSVLAVVTRLIGHTEMRAWCKASARAPRAQPDWRNPAIGDALDKQSA